MVPATAVFGVPRRYEEGVVRALPTKAEPRRRRAERGEDGNGVACACAPRAEPRALFKTVITPSRCRMLGYTVYSVANTSRSPSNAAIGEAARHAIRGSQSPKLRIRRKATSHARDPSLCASGQTSCKAIRNPNRALRLRAKTMFAGTCCFREWLCLERGYGYASRTSRLQRPTHVISTQYLPATSPGYSASRIISLRRCPSNKI